MRANPHHQIRYFYEPVPGLLSGRHRGAREAHGTLLVFVDDDIDADPRWLQAIVATFADPSVQLVGGRNLPHYAITPPTWLDSFWGTTPYGGRACGYLSLMDLGENMLDIDANYIWGLNFAIRSQALFDLGGFHPDIVPSHLQHFQGDGETGLTIKANTQGYRAIYQPKALVYHRIPAARLTLEYFERRAFFQGVCDSFTAIRQSGGITVPQIMREAAHEVPGRRLVRYACHLIRHPRSNAYRILRRLAGLKVKHMHERIEQAYRAGYDFHHNAVREHPILLGWVLRENYWDYHLPELLVPFITASRVNTH